MNRFLGDQSVLLLDNCRIHKSEQLQKAFEDKGLYFSAVVNVHGSWGDRLYSQIYSTILTRPQSN